MTPRCETHDRPIWGDEGGCPDCGIDRAVLFAHACEVAKADTREAMRQRNLREAEATIYANGRGDV